jgi:hypothetical protein
MKLAAAKPAAPPEDDVLNGFGSETQPSGSTGRPPRKMWLAVVIGCIGGLALIVAGTTVAAWRGLIRLPSRSTTVNIESTPSGAEVFLAGVSKGRAPLSFTVAPGEYDVEVVSEGERVPLKVTAVAGSIVSHHVRFAAASPLAPAPAVAPTSLVVSTDPSHLRVSVDNVDRGPSPVRVTALPAGAHHIHVDAPTGALDREVQLHDGESLSVVVAAAHAALAAAAGWVTIATPLPLRILENGQLVGTSDAARLMLAAGAHDLQFVNDDTGFQETRHVAVTAGKSAAVRIAVPDGRLSINAVPWADVWVDTQHVGETPIGNFAVPIGSHQVIFRHPSLGERRERVTVGTRDVARIAVDFGKR